MRASVEMRGKLERAYLEFFENAERKRRWSVFDDIPWDALERDQRQEPKAIRIETFCAEELYVPDYCSQGVDLTRSVFGFAWFQINWSYEESKHGLALREYLTRSGLRTEQELEILFRAAQATPWRLPFPTAREMACYGAFQEAATFVAYMAQKKRAAETGDTVLEAIFTYLSRDEAAHAGFYRTVIALALEEDRQGTIADLAHVLANFRMPGEGLIPDYQGRLRDGRGGISTRDFLQRAVLSTLRSLGATRQELRAAAPLRAREPVTSA